ncbi:MAG: hypothetical protein H6730_25530 [Deltaproteobacteria bacterium]|nr:hypothetical protein [Deltaproteobacteria bacterium]
MVVVRDGAEEAAWVLVPGEAEALPSSLALGDGAGVYLFDYTDSAELLGLSPGPRIDDPDNTRVLPSTGGFTGRLSGGEVSWSADADLAVLATVRWPELDWNACLRRGGCGERARSDAPLLCSATCLASGVLAPEAPNPPRIEGWSTRGVGHGLDLPYPPDPGLSCPAPTALWYGADACARVAECPTGAWPAEPGGAGAVWYVAEGGVGTGHGAEDALGSLSSALQLAAPGDTILLSGALEAPAVWTLPVTVIGACPDRAELTAPAQAERVELAATGLRLLGLTLPHLTVSASVSVAEVRVGGGLGPAVQVEATGELVARRALVDADDAQGILLAGGRVQLKDAVIRGAFGRGIDATGGGWSSATPGSSGPGPA